MVLNCKYMKGFWLMVDDKYYCFLYIYVYIKYTLLTLQKEKHINGIYIED